MASMSTDEIDALLRAPQVGVLATADDKGRPEGTPIWFDWDGERVRVLVHRDSRKARNIRANPHVSLTVDTRAAPYRGVVLRGTAELSGPDPQLRRSLAIRYLGEQTGRSYVEKTAALDAEDALVTIHVTSRYSWDYSKGF
jgi:PPOX class probable F420-dependent enzyme